MKWIALLTLQSFIGQYGLLQLENCISLILTADWDMVWFPCTFISLYNLQTHRVLD